MKYLLILGYQLFEEYKTFPKVRVRINDNLLDEFTCDNRKNRTVSCAEKTMTEVEGEGGFKHTTVQVFEHQFNCPAKYKVYELDDTSWAKNKRSTLKIEVFNNKSNYNNGFMNRKSLVSFNPIFLIRKDLIEDPEKLFRLIKYESWAEAMFPMKRPISRWKWPGMTSYEVRAHDIRSSHEDLCKGGDTFSIHFEIVKKYNMRILCKEGDTPEGIFHIENFFKAWLNGYLKKDLLLQTQLAVRRDLIKNNLSARTLDDDTEINVQMFDRTENK